jgi:hypothetical protein
MPDPAAGRAGGLWLLRSLGRAASDDGGHRGEGSNYGCVIWEGMSIVERACKEQRVRVLLEAQRWAAADGAASLGGCQRLRGR